MAESTTAVQKPEIRTSEPSVKNVTFVPAVEKTIHILEYLQSADEGATLTTISNDLNIPKSSAYRILGTLEHYGYLVQENGSSLFTLGPRVLTLAKAVQKKMNLIKIAMPFLEKLENATGETSKLSVMSYHDALVVAKVQSSQEMRPSTEIGSRFPLYASAAGKILLAHAPEEIVDEIVQAGLQKFTHTTIIAPEKLQAELAAIRQKGFAEDNEERFEGIRAIACPVFNHDNKVVGAVSIPYFATRSNEKRRSELLTQLFACARGISEALGHV